MKKYILPAVLSGTVCPGLGQMVKGEVLKGVSIIAGLILGLFVNVILYVLFPLWLGIILTAGPLSLYLWNIYDAYRHVPKEPNSQYLLTN
jgi:TM2 domain-containing membrane protein YozV